MSKSKSTRGFYHTGENSFDNPEISFFADDAYVPSDHKYGPFRTYQAAHRDMERMVLASIRNLRGLAIRVRNLAGKVAKT